MPVIQKISCQVTQITDHGDHVYSLELIPDRKIPLFHPGQFLHLALDGYDPSGFWPDSRAFSIASSPAQREILRLTYSVQGRFTARMERELVIGQKIWVKLPYGEFVVGGDTDVVLMAGGTGISAFTAYLAALKPDLPHSVTLFYGARHNGLLLYREMLDEQASSVPGLRVFYQLESGNLAAGELRGRLSIQDAWERLGQPLLAHYFLSGPPIMLKTLSQDLRSRGIAESAIHTDAWA
jgi:NAD(P)H-flavin reductase